MKMTLRAFIFLLGFAIIGAPLGMARMMGGHEAGVAAHQHGQRQQAPGKASLHTTILVCAACVGLDLRPGTLLARLMLAETIASAEFTEPEGVSALPLLPPPRA